MILFNINMATILFILILGHLLTGGLIVAYKWQQQKSRAVRLFLLSKLLYPAAWAMLGVRGTVLDSALVAVGNSILFIGAAVELIAFMTLKNNYTGKVKRNYAVLLIVCIIIFIGGTVYGFPDNIRIALASSVAAILMAFPVYKLFTDKEASRLQKVVVSFYGLIIISLLFRAIAALTTDMNMNMASTSIFNTWLFLLLYMVMLVASTGFILLDKEKQDLALAEAASIDGLTNLLNRRTFIERSKELIALAERRQEPISYLLIDIDDFKKINDKYGHFIGDTVLQSFAGIMKKQLRNCDLCGRYGGEEFAVLLPGADEGNAKQVAEGLRKTIENSSVKADHEIKYTISIGFCSIIPDRETNVDKLYRLSDQALYAAKAQGKNCCRN